MGAGHKLENSGGVVPHEASNRYGVGSVSGCRSQTNLDGSQAVKKKSPRQRVTMRTIAARAGVSPATVSLVFNGRDKQLKISDQTRQRVLDALREMNYRPDVAARTLQGQRTRTIGVLWSLSGYNPIVTMVNSLALMADRHGYVSVLIDHLCDAKKTAAALDDLTSRRVDAIVLDAERRLLMEPAVRSRLRDFTAAVVVCNEFIDLPCDIVVHRREPLYEQASQHLLRTGRRRLAIVMPNRGNHDLKIAAVRRVIDEVGVGQLIELRFPMTYPDVDPISGQERLVQTLETHFRAGVTFDALLCASDEDAMHCIRWLRGRQLRVPEDVAVVGANDTLMGRVWDPPLASGARHNEQLAATIEGLLFKRLRGDGSPPRQTFVDMEFICRSSAASIEP
jgi:LacI family transcriptional regulator